MEENIWPQYEIRKVVQYGKSGKAIQLPDAAACNIGDKFSVKLEIGANSLPTGRIMLLPTDAKSTNEENQSDETSD